MSGSRMKTFSNLYTLLDETTKTSVKVRALRDYFAHAPAEDAAWAVYFLIGRRPRQVVPSGKLRAWAAEEAGVPGWLFQESYDAVGDLAETIALLLPPPKQLSDLPLSYWIEQRCFPCADRTKKISTQLCSKPGASLTTGSGLSGTSSSAVRFELGFRSSL